MEKEMNSSDLRAAVFAKAHNLDMQDIKILIKSLTDKEKFFVLETAKALFTASMIFLMITGKDASKEKAMELGLTSPLLETSIEMEQKLNFISMTFASILGGYILDVPLGIIKGALQKINETYDLNLYV